ncbi:hypothetical protein SOVF_118010 [Spinacia oleracea]|uniref:Disease resistance protein RGA3 n=1 Tax=Spinacia oleracea TaxID=3562 RepID=A0A9R0K6R8_SPIOL|nr:putative disease resistance protein RGA3 [Spinacia oleracea]KNA13300.1 hypothetical protein SOVF_118010 [Spinacia oleracea]
MESVVLPLLTEAAKPMIEVLMSRVTAEIHSFRGYEEDLSKLQSKIQIISNTVLHMTATNTTSSSNTMDFSWTIWISDLKDFNIQRILNKMVEFLGRGNYEDASSEIAIRKLQEYLSGKRYLLVLDDVWNTHQETWDTMRNSLERIGGSIDSMVLATTRGDNVAETMHASVVHRLSHISEEDSWSLFKEIAFANRPEGDVFALEAIGRKIAEKCKGVPLAIKSIGGLMLRKKTHSEWMTIEESSLWNISFDETGILPSLKLSYDYLSSSFLKKCFSLCAIWRRGIWFERYDLRDRWMALGLIQKSNDENTTLEDIGDAYFNELLSISFLLVYERNELGDPFIYILHDLVYDLARLVASHECLYLESGKKVNNVLDIQHVTVVGHAEITWNFPDKLVLENICSLDVLGKLPEGLLMHVKYLRVLSIEHSYIVTVPKSFARLKCLKFLDLANNPIQVLPECIMELYNLQSLILYHCNQLLELPGAGGRLSNLVNLRHLGLSFDLCPAEGVIRQLNQLQILPPLRMTKGGFQISELGCLHQIRGNLEIKGLELIKCKSDAEMANLSTKSKVEQLRLVWDSENNCINHEEVLDALYPNLNLKLLFIKGYAGDKFPTWVTRMNTNAGVLYNLIKIQLIDCGRCEELPTLGHLPSLKKLEITNMLSLKRINPEFYDSSTISSCSMEYFTSLV